MTHRPPLSPLEKDPLFVQLTHGRSRATQILPNYQEFRLGHGDPLMAASVRNQTKLATRGTPEPEIHLIQKGSPLGGILGMNDIVHIGRDSITSLPCLPLFQDDDDNDEEDQPEEAVVSGHHSRYSDPTIAIASSMDNVVASGSPLGMRDHVHLPNGEVLSIPCMPFSDQ